jgi:hypothetical protein
VTIQLRRNTAANSAANNAILAPGEPGFETDTGRIKVGNGILGWNDLPYLDEQNVSPVFVYGEDGNLETITYTNGTVKSFTYNANGDITQIDHNVGAYTIRKVFTYDVNNDLEEITQTMV